MGTYVLKSQKLYRFVRYLSFKFPTIVHIQVEHNFEAIPQVGSPRASYLVFTVLITAQYFSQCQVYFTTCIKDKLTAPQNFDFK